jgi:hydrogenase maturation protease
MSNRCKILIAGVGNELCSDDGIGVHAIRELEKHPIPGVTFADLGTAVLHTMSFLEDADRVLVIDAARGGKPPGTIFRFDVSIHGPIPMMTSLHAMGLCEAARVLLLGKPLPAMTVLGVEPEILTHGFRLSSRVQMALPAVVSMARKIAASWISGDGAGGRPPQPEAAVARTISTGQTSEALMI